MNPVAEVTEADVEIPTVAWDDFRRNVWRYRQGQHVTFIGPTNSGKSTLALALLPHDRFPVVFRTKRVDSTLDRGTKGFTTLRRFDVHDPDVYNRIVLAPPLPNGARSFADQREVFSQALEAIFKQGGWTVFLDEIRYMTDTMKLEQDVTLLLQQGRSMGVGVWSCVQRPRHIPLLAYDQAGHLFMWHNADLQVQDRLGELCGGTIDPDIIERGISRLRGHQVLYVNTVTGTVAQTEVEI